MHMRKSPDSGACLRHQAGNQNLQGNFCMLGLDVIGLGDLSLAAAVCTCMRAEARPIVSATQINRLPNIACSSTCRNAPATFS